MAPRGGVRVVAQWEGTLTTDCQRKVDTMAAHTLDALDGLGQTSAAYARGIAPVRSGAYRAGLTSRRAVLGRRIGVDVKSTVPHASLVERGRKPGKPPPVSVVMRTMGVSDPGLAFVIARRIGAKGTKGKRVMSKTRKAMKGRLDVEGVRLGQWLNDLDAH